MVRNFSIIVTTMIMALTLTCCQKTEPKNSEIPQEDLALSKKITSFIDRMNHPMTLKNGEDILMDVDSALWNMEAAINYMYDNMPPQYEYLVIDSSSATITLQVNAGMCSETDMANAFEQLLNELEAYFNVHVDVQLIAAGIKATSDSGTGNIRLKLQYLFTEAPAAPPIVMQPTLVPFNEGCCPYPLATKIKSKINNYYMFLHQNQNIGYWTDIEIVDIDEIKGEGFYNPDDVIWDDNDRDYLIYHTDYRHCSHCFGNMYWLPCTFGACLNADDCNFYLNSTFGVLTRANTPGNLGVRPSNKTLIQITFAMGDIYPSMEEAHKDHFFDIKYGVPHLRPKEETYYPIYN